MSPAFTSSLDGPADHSVRRETDCIIEPVILSNKAGCGSSIGSSYEKRAVRSSDCADGYFFCKNSLTDTESIKVSRPVNRYCLAG